MRSQSAVRQTLPIQCLRLLLLATLVIAGVLASRVATAANDSLFDCDRLATELRSLEVPPTELPLDGNEHLDGGENPLAVLDGNDALSVAESFATPVLLLTPRVASIMREVFGALPITQVEKDATDADAAAADTDESAASSPVVQAPQEQPRVVLPGGGGIDAGSDHFIPRFQRQMYRTDI